MTPRRRITVALIGLLALVVGVWLAQQAPDEPPGDAHPPVITVPP